MKKDEILYFQAIKYMQDLLNKPNFDEELEKILEEINFYRDKTGELPAFRDGEEPIFDSTENFRRDILNIHIPELLKENSNKVILDKVGGNKDFKDIKNIILEKFQEVYDDNIKDDSYKNTSEYLKAA